MDHAAGHGSSAAWGWLEAIETSAAGQALRQSLWMYPASEVVHLLGMTLMVGAIVVYDLRLLGYGRPLALETLGRLVLPGSVIGFAFVLASGIALTVPEATALAVNPVLWIKLGLIALGLLNALVFHLGPYRTMAVWGAGVAIPAKVRIAAATSIATWVLVITLGRLIAYF